MRLQNFETCAPSVGLWFNVTAKPCYPLTVILDIHDNSKTWYLLCLYDYSVRDRVMFCHRRGLDSVDVHLTPRASQLDSLNAATPPTIF